MSLAHSILGFLSYGNSTGYDLAKIFNSSVRFFWSAQTSQVYLELGKLEKDGFVLAERVIQAEKPNKKVYSITEAGKEEFINWLSANTNEFAKGAKEPFLVKVFFSGCQSHEDSVHMLKKFVADCKNSFSSMESVPNSIDDYGKQVAPHHVLHWMFTIDYGRSHMQTCIDWAERCIKKLEEIK